MEILAARAGKLVQCTVEPIGRQVGYLAHYKTNYQNLQTKLEDLTTARDDFQQKADQAKRRGKRIVPTGVLNWKRRVDAIITETEDFLKDSRHAHTKCLHGFCPHLGLRYQLSKKAIKLGEEIDQLIGKKVSEIKFDEGPLQDPCLISTGDYYCNFDSRNSTVRRVMNALGNPETETVLVCGIGGVGKTTLVEEVLRQAKHENLFDDLVMVRDVKENPDLVKIQRQIATQLGLSIVENDTLAERALKLCDRIKDKRVLVALDDVWKEIDLVAIGLPRLVNCKLLLTSRIRKNLSLDTRTQEDIPLNFLNEDEAWSLFEKMAGDVVKDSRTRSVAIEVAKKCGQLPILIVTVARAMKGIDKLGAWRDTRRRLGAIDKKRLGEKAYLALEWSYNQLEEEELKPLFLLCGIIVVQDHICLADLLKYGYGLGLIKNVDTIEEARDALDALVEKLKDSCLLLDSDKNRHVRMHDLVCEVALRIASKEQHVLSVEYGGELKEWPDRDFFEKCSKMSLKSNKIPKLSEVPAGECHRLDMFYLYSKDATSVEIPANFFCEMEKLRVFGFIGVRLPMLSLPSSFEFLKNLQSLSLEECELEDVTLVGCLSNLEILSFARSYIKQLPKEIGHLIRLRWLDLSDCRYLKVISPNVISRLVKLEELTMRNVKNVKWEAERGGSNASLLELKDLSQLTALFIHIPDADILPLNLFSGDKLVRYQIYIGDVQDSMKTLAETNLNKLKLKLTTSNEMDQGIITLLKRCDDLSLEGTQSVNDIQENVDFTYIINRKVVFPRLTTLDVHRCHHLKFLFSFSTAKSLVELKRLVISECEMMEELISTEDQSQGENIDIMFSKLETLELSNLPNLIKFCTESCTDLSPVNKLHTEGGASIFDPPPTTLSSKNPDVRTCLFDARVKLPSLERLTIFELGKLKTLWNNKLADQDSFHRLKQVGFHHCDSLMNMFVPRMMGRLNALETLDIRECGSLEVVFEEGESDVADTSSSSSPQDYCQNLGFVSIMKCKSLRKIFTASVARGLQKLHSLRVESCYKVEEIIGGEQEGLETEPPLFVFPKVTKIDFDNMPKLGRIYPGMHVSKWPSLKTLSVGRCGKEVLAAEVPEKHEQPQPGGIEQSLFLIQKDSFPKLETLSMGFPKIWYGPSSSALVFSTLESITFYDPSPFYKQATIDLLNKLHKLAKLTFSRNGSVEILFVNQEMNGGEEIHPVGTLSGVKTLEISCMDKLLQLGNGNSETAGPVFPNLDTLYVSFCDMLKSLESSAISFRYLTSVKVRFCRGLEYLTSYDVAKNLMQLTILEVEYCDVLREIVRASSEDDHNTCEIAFSRLQLLKLERLPRLQGFCSGTCIVKLPPSTELKVNYCPIELKISSQGVLLSNPKPER